MVSAVRAELTPSMRGFFGTSANAPVRGIISNNRLILTCVNKYILDIINKPDIIALVARKASAKLGKPVGVAVADSDGSSVGNAQLEQLLDFGRTHSDIIKITDNND